MHYTESPFSSYTQFRTYTTQYFERCRFRFILQYLPDILQYKISHFIYFYCFLHFDYELSVHSPELIISNVFWTVCNYNKHSQHSKRDTKFTKESHRNGSKHKQKQNASKRIRREKKNENKKNGQQQREMSRKLMALTYTQLRRNKKILFGCMCWRNKDNFFFILFKSPKGREMKLKQTKQWTKKRETLTKRAKTYQT